MSFKKQGSGDLSGDIIDVKKEKEKKDKEEKKEEEKKS